MQITVTGRLDDESTYILSRRLWAVRSAKQAVKKVSFAGEKAIKLLMPVDTGRARASWGHWTPRNLRKKGREAGIASPADSVWETTNDGLTQTQGSNVEYIEELEAGTSLKQAAGFIEATFNKMQRELDLEIDYIMGAF